MAPRIKLRFFEREFFTGNLTQDNIRGIEPILAKVDNQLVETYIVEPERMKHAEYIDTILSQIVVPPPSVDFDLTMHLSSSQEGEKWLEANRSLRAHMYSYANVPPDISKISYRKLLFSIQTSKMPSVKCVLFPEDYGEKNNYCSPLTSFESLPSTAVYVSLSLKYEMVFTKFDRSEEIILVNMVPEKYVYRADGRIWKCSLSKPTNFYEPVHGAVLGIIQEGDIHYHGNLENGFPLQHYVEFMSRIPFGDTSFNPMSIKVDLVKD